MARSDAGIDEVRARQELERLLDRLAEATLRFGDVGSVVVAVQEKESSAAPSFAAAVRSSLPGEEPCRRCRGGLTDPAALDRRALACQFDRFRDLSGGRLHLLLTASKQGPREYPGSDKFSHMDAP